MNPAAEKSVGFDMKDKKNVGFHSVFINDSRERVNSLLLSACNQADSTTFFENDLVIFDSRKNKEVGGVSLNLTLNSVDGNRFLVAIVRKSRSLLRQGKRIENSKEQLAHISNLAEIGHRSVVLMHEIRNPLAVIAMTNDTLREASRLGCLKPEMLEASLAASSKAVQKIEKMISKVKRQSLSGENKRQTISLAEVLEDILLLVKKEFDNLNIELERDITCLDVVKCDVIQIEQVLLNLFNNALHALENVEYTRKIKVSLWQEDDECRISVWNNGPAIPKKIQDRIIEPFFTTKAANRGTGLGLSVSYSVMRSHGGHLSFKSQDGEGTTFVLTFPKVQSHFPTNILANKKVVIVDDEQTFRQVFAFRLKNLGAQVVEASNGQEALEVLEKDSVDLIFTDFRMPKMDGLEFTDRAKRKYPEIPILLISAFIPMNTSELPVDRCLPKPLVQEELLQAISEVLDEAESGEERKAS